MRRIVVTNHKGGSAKTTTTVNLAAALGERGHRVLVIDLDPQGSASSWLGVSGTGRGIGDAIAGRVPLAQLTYETTAPGVLLVPASPSLVAASPAEETQIALGFMRAMDDLPAMWDIVLVDCPPSLGYLSIAPLTVCQEALIPVEARVLAVTGLTSLLETMRRVRRKLNPTLDVAGVVACRVNRTAHARAIVDRLAERFPDSFMRTIVRENIRLAEAPSYQLPITLYAPDSSGAEDHRSLAAELVASPPAATSTVAVTVNPTAGSRQPSVATSTLARLSGAVSAGLNRMAGASVATGDRPSAADETDAADDEDDVAGTHH